MASRALLQRAVLAVLLLGAAVELTRRLALALVLVRLGRTAGGRAARDRQMLQKLIELRWAQDRVAANDAYIDALRAGQVQRQERQRAARSRIVPLLPVSSDAFCQGTATGNRTCRFRNLCMDTRTDRAFVLKGPHSLFVNVPRRRAGKELLDLTTVAGHNVYTWGWEEVSADFFLRQADNLTLSVVDLAAGTRSKPRSGSAAAVRSMILVKGRTFLTKRFFPVNIMHVFHDDWLGLYALRDLWPTLRDPHDEHYDAQLAPLLRGVTFFDGYPESMDYDETYEWLGRLHHQRVLLGRAPEAFVCYEDAVVGSSKQLAWYQYGYETMQGPIKDHEATGWKLREAALYILRRLDPAAGWDERRTVATIHRILNGSVDGNVGVRAHVGGSVDTGIHVRINPSANANAKTNANANSNTATNPDTEADCIAIFSRLSTRRILNEQQLGDHLSARFGLPICWVRLEDHARINGVIAILRRAVMAFGMHGSLLILAMFMPPGAVLVEGFPYGVPPANYTPYRTMAGLDGMYLAYRAWGNTDVRRNVAHPEREARLGGIMHLSAEERARIVNSTTIPEHPCCDNPHWLFRIFQDTVVDVDAVYDLMREALVESYASLPDSLKPVK